MIASHGFIKLRRTCVKAHRSGRIAHVASLNGARGEKLKAIFSRIEWAR